MREQSRLSLEYFEAEVTANGPDGVPLEPATLPVEFAFVAIGTEPADADWVAAAHQRDDVFGVLIGPTALALEQGDYDVWRRITDTPEMPVGAFGKLRIY